MAIATYPAGLPRWHSDAYTLAPKDPSVRTQMDSGTRRVRRRFIRVPTDVNLKTLFTDAQFVAFQAWWENEAYAGSAWVNLPLTNGNGAHNVQSRFTAMYQAAQNSAGLWLVTVPAETMALPVSNG